MESVVSGQVVCDGFTNHRGLQRFVEKRINEWAQCGPGEPGAVRYQVLFEREGEEHRYGCYVQISCGKTVWSGSGLSKDPYQALQRCLARLSPRLAVSRAGLSTWLAPTPPKLSA